MPWVVMLQYSTVLEQILIKLSLYSIQYIVYYDIIEHRLFSTDVDIPLTAANVHPVLDRVRSALLPVPG